MTSTTNTNDNICHRWTITSDDYGSEIPCSELYMFECGGTTLQNRLLSIVIVSIILLFFVASTHYIVHWYVFHHYPRQQQQQHNNNNNNNDEKKITLPFELTKATRIKENMNESIFIHQLSINIVEFVYCIMIGSVAFYATLRSVSRNPAVWDDTTTTTTSTTMITDSTCEIFWYGGIIGIFKTAFALYQIISTMILHWGKKDQGWDMKIHHLSFFCLGLFLEISCQSLDGHHDCPHEDMTPPQCSQIGYRTRMSASELGVGSCIMDLSSPILIIMLTFRRLVGYENVVTLSKLMLGFLFLILRVCGFGYVVWMRALMIWWKKPDLFWHEGEMDVRATVVIHVLCLVGWVLQLFWFYSIVRIALGGGGKKKKKVD